MKVRTMAILGGLATLATLLILPQMSSADRNQPPRFDSDRGLWFEDINGDGIADVEAPASESKVDGAFFDTDRGLWLIDSDGDGFVDLTEKLAGKDPSDPRDFPGNDMPPLESAAGFPTTSCRSQFVAAGSRLCIDTHEQNATTYDQASAICRSRSSHVCSYDDLFYLYTNTTMDSSYNPSENWIGDRVYDDTALYGNRSITYNGDPDMYNFEGTYDTRVNRSYWCCHDRE